MNIIAFIVAVSIYFFFCFGVVRLYFFLAGNIYLRSNNAIIKNGLIYALFAIFVLTVIPIGIFFPAWISEKLDVIDRSPSVTIMLILFGCAVLVTSLWMGWRSKEGRRFASTMNGHGMR